MEFFKTYIWGWKLLIIIPLCLLGAAIQYHYLRSDAPRSIELSGAVTKYERGFGILDVDQDALKKLVADEGAITQIVMLSCIHCIGTAQETYEEGKKHGLNIIKSHPYFNDVQRRLSVFFYLTRMDEQGDLMVKLEQRLNELKMMTASSMSDDDLYRFYIDNSTEPNPLEQSAFEKVIAGDVPSAALDKAQNAKALSDLIKLKATPAFLYGNHITTFGYFSEEGYIFKSLKALGKAFPS